MGDDTVDLILEVFIFGKDLTFFHLLYDPVYELEALSVRRFHRVFILQVDVRLYIRGLLAFSLQCRSGSDRFLQTLMAGGCGNRLDDRAALLFR